MKQITQFFFGRWESDFYKIENRSISEIKTGYYLEILKKQVKQWNYLEALKNITKNGEDVPHLEITEVVLVQSNIVNKYYQLDSRILYIFVPNKSFGESLDITLKNFIFLETFHSEFSYNEV